MKLNVLSILILGLLFTANANADTFTLRNGATIDGKLLSKSGGIIRLQVGDRTVVYRENEIISSEENNKTGHFNRAEAEARVAARDKELIEKTGLAKEQRKEVKELLYQLQSNERGVRESARARLVTMQQEYDIYPFLVYSFDDLSHRLSPWVLQAIYYVDSKRSIEVLRNNLTHVYFGTRAMAITLLGEAGDRESAPQIARGLADAQTKVVFSAIEVLTQIHYREITPVLLDFAEGLNVNLRTASIQALVALWGDQVAGELPEDVEGWKDFWRARATRYPNAVQLAALEPLIDPSEEFMDE